MQLELRGTARTQHLDVTPQDAVRVASAERFHGCLLRRETAGEVNGWRAPPGAVGNLAARKDPLKESVAESRNRASDAIDVGGIEPEPDNTRHKK